MSDERMYWDEAQREYWDNSPYACQEPENPAAIKYHLDGDCGCLIALQASSDRAEASGDVDRARRLRGVVRWGMRA